MKHITSGILIFLLISLAACLIKPPEPAPIPWTKLSDYSNNTNIRLLHATSTELYILSDDEFARLNLDNELVEKRKLELPFDFQGRSAISDHSFHQLIFNDSLKLEINFHLTKNQDQIYKIKIEDYKESGDAAFLTEGEQRNTTTYNDDGAQFAIPFIQIPNSHYTLFLFDINLNATNTAFESIELAKRINIEDFPAAAGNLNSLKYIDGFYYMTSLHGAIRINSATGDYEKIFTDWILDVFKYEGSIYATGFDNRLYISQNNGLSFESVDLGENPPKMQLIEVINKEITSQQAIGFPFNIIDSEFTASNPLLLNEDFPEDFSAYQDLEYFNGNYYLPVFKELYYGPSLEKE